MDEQPIAVENVRKSFGQQKVLDNLNLRIEKGETLAVLGRSGTGKSVLLKILIGLQPADSGRVRLFGQDIAGLSTDQLDEARKKTGFLFQQAALYDSLTIFGNVEFPLLRHANLSPEERRSRVQELLSRVGVEESNDKLPSEISGGMQKRVGLARALALDPELLLLDEPTAGLDPITAREIADLIVNLRKQGTHSALVVTHDLKTAKRIADRLVLIDSGRVRAEGTLAELKTNKDEFVSQFIRTSG